MSCGKTTVLEAGLLAASWADGSKLVTGPTDRRAIRHGSKLYRIRAQIQVHGQESKVVVASPISQPLPMYEKRPVWYFSSWRAPALVGPVDATVGKRGRRPARNGQNGLLNVKQLLVNIATIERFDDRFPHLGRYSEIMPVINEAWREFYPERDESFSVEVVKSEEPAGGSFDVYLRTSEGFLLEVDLLSAGQLELFLFLSALALNKNRCEPTTHRFVRRAFHPTPHHPLECRPEPTPSTPARGGSGLHCRSGASRASSTGGRWSGSAARVLPPICEVSRVVTGTDAGNGGTGANERPSVANSNCLCHQSKRCAVGPRRQKRSDALSEKTKRCAVGSQIGKASFSLTSPNCTWTRSGIGRFCAA